jgi:hypothetical protein
MRFPTALTGAAMLALASGAAAQQEPAPETAHPTPAGQATAAGPAPAVGVEAAAKTVAADWAKYDKAGKGSLTALEFGTWILAAKGQDLSAAVARKGTRYAGNPVASRVLNATAAEFLKADRDGSRGISRGEMTAYLAS